MLFAINWKIDVMLSIEHKDKNQFREEGFIKFSIVSGNI